MMVIQARAFAVPEDGTMPPYDALLAVDKIGVSDRPLSELGQRLRDHLAASGLEVGLVDGGVETAGYEVGRVPQALYLAATRGKEFAILWLAPRLRSAYARREPEDEIGTFLTLGIPVEAGSLAGYLEAAAEQPAGRVAPLPDPLRELIEDYLDRRDVVALRQAQTSFEGFGLAYLHDPAAGQSYLVVRRAGGAPVAVANLAPRDVTSEVRGPAVGGWPDTAAIAAYVYAGAAWLLLASGR